MTSLLSVTQSASARVCGWACGWARDRLSSRGSRASRAGAGCRLSTRCSRVSRAGEEGKLLSRGGRARARGRTSRSRRGRSGRGARGPGNDLIVAVERIGEGGADRVDLVAAEHVRLEQGRQAKRMIRRAVPDDVPNDLQPVVGEGRRRHV